MSGEFVASDFGWSGPVPVTVQPGDVHGFDPGPADATLGQWAAGLAAGGSAGAASASTFLGITPLGWAVIGVSLLGSFLMRGKKKGRLEDTPM